MLEIDTETRKRQIGSERYTTHTYLAASREWAAVGEKASADTLWPGWAVTGSIENTRY